VVVIGAWLLVNHQEGANAFFKAGMILLVASVFWYWLSEKQKRSLKHFNKASE
jgi:hypothetical protein